MRYRALTLRALALYLAVALASLAQPVAGLAAAAAPRSDPQQGPHSRDEARHAGQTLRFTPARSAIVPRATRPRAAAQAAPATAGTFGIAGTLQREVFGFAPYWALPASSQWNYSLLSTVAYFGIDINADGSIATNTRGWTGWNSQDLVDTINRAHTAGDRAVVVAKAFDEATINQIVTNPTSTQKAITSIIDAIASKSMDGVNIDFEGYASPSYPNIQAGFTNFMSQLSTRVHQRWPSAQVTVDTYSGSASWDGGLYNIGQLGQVVDGIFVMAYDMGFSNLPGRAAPNAPLNGWTYNDTNVVSQYLAKAPASKVILGVPYYGYKWSTADANPYSTVSGGATAVTYSGILDDFACAQKLTISFDTTAQSPWASWWSPPTGDPCLGNYNSWRELYYDDVNSLGLKYDLVNRNDLMGTGMWALGYDGTSSDLWQVLAVKFQTSWPGQYHSLAPARILDTRFGTGGYSSAVGPQGAIDVIVAGRGGVPLSGAASVLLNVTVTGPAAAGYVSLYPAGAVRPPTSSLNFGAGQTVANLVAVPLGKGGKVTTFNSQGQSNIIFDVAGWVSTAVTTSGGAGRYQSLVPARILDTRNGTGGFSAPLGQGQSLDMQVLGQGGVPASGVSAVVVNLTAVNPTANGWVGAYPTGSPRTGTSNVNFSAGQTVPNRAVVQVGAGGKVSLYNFAGQSDLVVDVGGWFADGSVLLPAGRHTGLVPARILDTRAGIGGISRPLGAGIAVISVAGQGGVPAMGGTAPPTAVVLNVTVTNSTVGGFISIFPNGVAQPVASDLNFVAGQTVPNLVMVRLGTDGNLAVYNRFGSIDLIFDVVGWFD